MDRNTVIGLVMIGLILSVFTIFNQPSEEEIKEQQKTAQEAEKKAKSKKDATAPSSQAAKKETSQPIAKASVEESIVRLENDLLSIDFSNIGGKVAAVYLKNYETYDDYAKKDGKLTPLALFKKGDAYNELVFPLNGKTIHTAGYPFTLKEQTKNKLVYALDLGEGKSIEQVYQLKKDAYDIDYHINIKGFEGAVAKNQFGFRWKTDFRKTERLFSEQRRVSTICYRYKNGEFSYLSEMSDDYQELEDQVEWIAYKQSYFSSILKPQTPFTKDNGSFKVTNFKDRHSQEWSHLKGYHTMVGLPVSNADQASLSFNWYFGPNDYKLLKSYDSNYDDILNFGWGLFRWINLYAVQPVFNFLGATGVSVGIAILLLTLILKFVLMPIQWKMYVSSAKMRILKPEIDELNAKFPNKEDAMKKQMEMMTLYRESGASPLAGCVPMLIQMPILLAVFRFFPSAFELRQQPFLWAEDLSSYDSIWNFGINIWPYGDHMSLFTLLMAGTTLIYTVMNSGNMQQPQQPGMPNMKVIMYIFPIMMIFFFNNYSSGLSYYYFISTLISILIMLLIKKFFVNEEKLKLKMAERKAAKAAAPGKEKKKSKFQERLEQMQKAQMEQRNKRK